MKTLRVSHKTPDDTILVTIKVNGKERNMNRPTDECLEKFYTRIQAILAQRKDKQLKKVAKKKDSETVADAIETSLTSVPEVHLLDIHGNEFSPEEKACDFWSKASILRLPNDDYKVLYNSPHINRIDLADAPVSGTILFPRLQLEFATQEFSRFTWYRSSSVASNTQDAMEWMNSNSQDHQDKDDCSRCEWEMLHNDKFHLLTGDDVGHKFKVSVRPGSSDWPASDTESCEISSFEAVSGPVVAGPGSFYFTCRHAHTEQPCGNGRFRFVCYNILAECYSTTEFARNDLFPYCPSPFIDMSYRIQLVVKELAGYNSDVVCLQEVDRFVFEEHLVHAMSLLNFGGAFGAKRQLKEGVALFYNRSKFKLLSVKNRILQDSFDNDEVNTGLRNDFHEAPELIDQVRQKATCVLIALLQSQEDPNRLFIVANTHLYWHPRGHNIRLVQVKILLNVLESYIKEVTDSRDEDCKINYILCGDLNSRPGSGVIELLETGNVRADSSDWYSGGNREFHRNTSLVTSHPLNFTSACGHPVYTNYVAGFEGCLDYIFINPDQLGIERVISQPEHRLTVEHSALPSIDAPSDHIAQVVDLGWESKQDD